MEINKELLDKWNKLNLKGDYELIANSLPNKKHPETIRRCVTSGQIKNMEIFTAIKDFYEKREIELAGNLENS